MQEPANKPQNPVTIHHQYVKDLSFENPNVLKRMQSEDSDSQPSVNIELSTDVNKLMDNTYEVELEIRVDVTRDDSQEFLVDLKYAGVVSLAPQLEDEFVAIALMVHVPTLLFPYARQIIAQATIDGGYPPLMLQPVDFAAMFMQNQEKAQQAH